MNADRRVVYGATCLWWDSITQVSVTGHGLPCCPHCGGVLYEVETEAVWWAQVDAYEAGKPWPGYRAFVTWLRGRCFPSRESALGAYRAGLN